MNRSSTILIVDDDAAGRETLEYMLAKHNYQLDFATNGKEALKKASEDPPDLILLDVMMPEMDGFEVCQRLRNDPLLSEVPIILVTALDDRESRLQGIEAGADDFISKPFDRTELRARVRTITRLNRYRRLLAERTRFEWVSDQAEDGFVIIDEMDNIRYSNRRAQLYLNLPSASSSTLSVVDPSNYEQTFLGYAKEQYQCQPPEAWEGWPESPIPLIPDQPTPLMEPQGQEAVRYLVRPETPTSQAMWLHVDTLDLPGSQDGRLIRLHDVSSQMAGQRTMWTFHSLISHKLRTPLSGLINSLYLLMQDNKELSPEDVQEFASIAFGSSQRLREQIENIMRYLKTPDLAYPGQGCHMQDLQEIIGQIREEVELGSVHISGLEASKDARFVLSRQAIELMLRQVLENAKKFHPNKSPNVSIVLSPYTASVKSVGKLTIMDDGTSLASEQIMRAWTPYYQAERGFSGEVPGMGLGLAMVAALLWGVGGNYTIANRKPGPGIVVDLYIPLEVSQPQS